MNKNIVIVNYTYPPFNSIGSRRWAKFSKELANRGYTIHVIYSKNPYNQESNWTKDTVNKNIIKYELRNYWPKFCFHPSKNIFNKIANKIFLIIINQFFKGFSNDESRFWKTILQKKLVEICSKEKIDIVIASGPPFRVLLYSLMKNDFPEIKFYSDLRDEWLTGKLFNSKISKAQYNIEKKIQDIVIRKSDKILVTDVTNKLKIEGLYGDLGTKIKVIPHTIDIEEFNIVENSMKIDSKIKFIYGGNMPMIDKDDSIIPFLDALVSIQENHLEIYKKIEIHFYFSSDWMIDEVRERKLSNIYFNKLLAPIKFNEIACTFDYLLIFLPKHLKDYIITKNIDYLPLKKPIIICSKSGEASKNIKIKKIGIHLNTEEELSSQIINLIENKPVLNKENYVTLINKYNLQNVTNQLLNL